MYHRMLHILLHVTYLERSASLPFDLHGSRCKCEFSCAFSAIAGRALSRRR